MQDKQLVFRNTRNRDDAVYVITVTTKEGNITITGQWGRWSAYLNQGKLREKVYYTGTSEHIAQRTLRQLQQKRFDRGYMLQAQHSYTLSEEPPVTPAASTTWEPPETVQTRAGALEF